MSPGVHKRTPPSEHAMDCLRRAARAPFPAQEVNFTVADKLVLFGYATYEHWPSPYKSHKPGRTVPFLVVTDDGKMALRKAAIFAAGAKATKPKPSFEGKPLGSMESCTFFDGYASTHAGFVNPYSSRKA